MPGLGSYDDLVANTVAISGGDLPVPLLSLDQPKDREHLDQLLAIRKLRQKP